MLHYTFTPMKPCQTLLKLSWSMIKEEKIAWQKLHVREWKCRTVYLVSNASSQKANERIKDWPWKSLETNPLPIFKRGEHVAVRRDCPSGPQCNKVESGAENWAANFGELFPLSAPSRPQTSMFPRRFPKPARINTTVDTQGKKSTSNATDLSHRPQILF
jgi:hypothetical protein